MHVGHLQAWDGSIVVGHSLPPRVAGSKSVPMTSARQRDQGPRDGILQDVGVLCDPVRWRVRCYAPIMGRRIAPLGLLLLGLLACGGNTDHGEPSVRAPAESAQPSPQPAPTIPPYGCAKAGNCPGILFESEQDCLDTVENCVRYNVCGPYAFCGLGKCKKQPTCDPGDVLVTSCPAGGDCYDRKTCTGGGYGSTSEMKVVCQRAADAGTDASDGG